MLFDVELFCNPTLNISQRDNANFIKHNKWMLRTDMKHYVQTKYNKVASKTSGNGYRLKTLMDGIEL
jgi:hypothetical protein